MCWTRTALALTAAVAVAACGDDTTPTEPPVDQQAAVQGRVESTQPEPVGYPSFRSMNAGASGSASAVAVAELASDGSLNTLAQGSVEADGSFKVEGVPADRDNLVVVAQDASGNIVGRAMVHERTRAGAVATASPITHETTLEALAYAQMKAKGHAAMSSPNEVALLVRPNATAAAQLVASGEAKVVGDGVYTASDAMTRVYARTGASFDASARAEALAQAAVAYAQARYAGTSAEAAHEAFVQAALNATAKAGVGMEAMTMATAAAASSMDARLSGNVSARGEVISEAVRLNLKARERLAATFQSGAEGQIALQIMGILAEAETELRGAATAAQIRTVMNAHATAATNATVSGMVQALVPNASLLVRNDVEAKARAAAQAADLSARLSAAADAQAAAQATADYRAQVRAAVQALIEATGRADLNVESMTSLYIAAHGGAHIRS